MSLQLKRLSKQIVVITGATSGIGLVTARMAAKRGAKLVLTARSEASLRRLAHEITAGGGDAVYVAGDVGEERDVKRVAEVAVERYGGFDTWVNNAGVSIYGTLTEVSVEDMRKLFDTNVWGVVHGSRTAAAHLRHGGGAIVNVGSTLSDRAIPLQGIYCASKHAVKGFTDALRMELEKEGAPISVSLIKPSAIDTPYRDHAKNYLDVEPLNPPPVYAPETVAETILYCAEHRVRDVFVGAGGKAFASLGYYAPRFTDMVMEATLFDLQTTREPANPNTHRGLTEPSSDLTERGGYPGHVAGSSVYTKATLRGAGTGAALVACGLVAAGLRRMLKKRTA
jgi:short-subunit dehydrogenase